MTSFLPCRCCFELSIKSIVLFFIYFFCTEVVQFFKILVTLKHSNVCFRFFSVFKILCRGQLSSVGKGNIFLYDQFVRLKALGGDLLWWYSVVLHWLLSLLNIMAFQKVLTNNMKAASSSSLFYWNFNHCWNVYSEMCNCFHARALTCNFQLGNVTDTVLYHIYW